MKNKEAFEKWFETLSEENKKYMSPFGVSYETWKACEEFYEFRKCQDCKHLQVEHCKKNILDYYQYGRDFCCKYWEAK